MCPPVIVEEVLLEDVDLSQGRRPPTSAMLAASMA